MYMQRSKKTYRAAPPPRARPPPQRTRGHPAVRCCPELQCNKKKNGNIKKYNFTIFVKFPKILPEQILCGRASTYSVGVCWRSAWRASAAPQRTVAACPPRSHRPENRTPPAPRKKKVETFKNVENFKISKKNRLYNLLRHLYIRTSDSSSSTTTSSSTPPRFFGGAGAGAGSGTEGCFGAVIKRRAMENCCQRIGNWVNWYRKVREDIYVNKCGPGLGPLAVGCRRCSGRGTAQPHTFAAGKKESKEENFVQIQEGIGRQ